MNKKVILSTDFKDLKLFKRGKVRDVYDLDDKLLIVSTDRISCFDVVLPSGIPFKGKVLTCISDFWFDYTKDLVKNHIVMTEVDKFPDKLKKYRDVLSGRSMLVDKTKSLAVECVVRGYLSGSGWKEYKEKNEICGIKLPKGLKESMQLPEPIFTPSTKADVGHDMNVRQDYVENLLGKDMADKLREISIALYKKASSYAIKHGIIIADTKFEFGLDNNNEVILIDEALTPDSSRFWPLEEYVPGRQQPSFDKQFVRDYLESLNWNKNPPAPELPEEIIKTTSEKYLQAYKMLTGRELQI